MDNQTGGACAHRPVSGTEGVVANAARRRPLPRSFYERDSKVVARALLGTVLVCESPEGRASGRIVETEAYLGPSDPASHAAAGLTARTRHLFGRPGSAYIYFIYGVHWCVNAVAGRHGAGTAVLIRGLEPVDGIALMRARRWVRAGGRRRGAPALDGKEHRDRDLTNGPGKLCAALGIDARLNGVTLLRPPLTIRAGYDIPDSLVAVSPRIGITRAAELPCRFFVRDSPYVSRTPPHFVTEAFGGDSKPIRR
jgi:DNA-3-methyladenine glycosylase